MKNAKQKETSAYPITDHYNGNTFYNPAAGAASQKSFANVWKMLREKRKNSQWPKEIANKAIPYRPSDVQPGEAYITYVNHASHLIQLHNLTILTDPIFSKRAGPLVLLGPKRVRKPGLTLNQLPKIDVVLVSHNHYDHMDLSSLKKIEKKFHPLILVPLGNKKYFSKCIFKNVMELDWWQTCVITAEQSVTLVPAHHWSRRNLSDANTALWGGFYIKSAPIQIFFAGDTGYGPHFKQIVERLGPPDISILPIGAYEPRWFMKEHHMNPEEAVLASLDLQSRFSLATHHQTFHLSMESIDEPAQDLAKSREKYGLAAQAFMTPETGETVYYSQQTGQLLSKK